MPRTLLIVDDVLLNREILKRILAGEYEFFEAEDGRGAVAIMAREYARISAVLLDLSMPVMDGFAVLEYMRADEALSQLPVIVMTGTSDEDVEVRALSLGASDYVAKPYNAAIIRQRVHNIINLRETAATVNALRRDKLTGLYTREAFFERVPEMLAAREPGYYVMSCFDIDNFKIINDQFGTEEGDRLLKQVGRRALSNINAVNGAVCRISADNFAALYPAECAEKDFIVRVCDSDYGSEAMRGSVVFSVGRYVVSDPSLSPSAIYDRAYIAKRSVKGRYDTHVAYFDETMRASLVREQQIVAEMDQALAAGQFEVWLQPQYNHATGALIGAEALVRWRHPSRGMISPGVFVPIFERNGFIYELDKFVWEEVCRLLRRWIDEGREPLPVSVNISRYDVFRADITEVIPELTRRYGLEPAMLRLEITESAFAHASEVLIDIVRKLSERGYTVEIDDFGSGYSSLNTLKDVPASVLKLDMRFLEGGQYAQRGGNILESVVRMAKWLDMSVIAEGVETAAQADYLKSIGCSYVQGYLYAKPMPVDQYERLDWRAQREANLSGLETVANLDNNAFWDPSSMDTLIFNSYVGGACIYECVNGAIEMLRANDKFVRAFGSEEMTVEGALKLDWASHLDAENRARLEEALSDASRERSLELAFDDLPGCPGKIYLRVCLRVIASTGTRRLVYCTQENVTAEKLAERALRDTDEQLRFLNDVSRELLTQLDAESAIESMLGSLLAHFDATRAYVFELDERESLARNTYEVCAAGVRGEIENLRRVPLSAIAWWLTAFERSGFVSIEDVDALSDERPEKAILQPQGIRSLFAAPLRREGKVVGFLGVDDPQRLSAQVGRITALGDYLAVMLTRRDLNAKIRADSEALERLMNDIPGGFCRLRAEPDGTLPLIYVNEGFCRLADMTREQVFERFGENCARGIHPADYGVIEEIRRAARAGQTQFQGKCRLRHGREGYVLTAVSGRIAREAGGAAFLNVYFSDASAQEALEARRRELLDNMPCGAGICEVSGPSARMVYLNRRYRDYLKRDAIALNEGSIFDVIHPDDRARLREAMRPALKAGGEGKCDVRILGGDGQYIPFRLSGASMERTGEKNAIYVTFTPISADEAALGEMLTVALEAMMASQTDFTFVKDKNLRYVCGSRAFAKLLGLSDEKALVGKTDVELLGEERARPFNEDDRRVLASGKALIDYEERLPVYGGETRYGSTSKYLLHDSLGKVIGIYGVSRDVTARREEDSRFRLFADGVPGGLASYACVPGPFDAEHVRIRYFNDGFAKLFGFTREEYEARSVHNPMGLIFPEDRGVIAAQLEAMLRDGTPIDCLYRVRVKGGARKWIHHKAIVSERGETTLVNALLMDVTKEQEAAEQLRVNEQEYRIALRDSGNIIARYDVAAQCVTITPEMAEAFGLKTLAEHVPEDTVRQGDVAPESADAYIDFYERIQRGERRGKDVFRLRMADGAWRWMEARFTTIFTDAGAPVSAVISFVDVSERLEKEAVYRRWRQSLEEKPEESYTLWRCNISKETGLDACVGRLLSVRFAPGAQSFNARTMEYVEKYVCAEDQDRYFALVNSDALLASYYRGKRSASLEYRENVEGGGTRWLRLTVELVEYPNSADVEAYMMYENIDDTKRAELLTLERAETDPLTGVYNRAAFAARAERLMSASRPDARHALMMLDIDGFKLVNDAFGHAAGDQTLVELAGSLRASVRRNDVVGRLGGDEFLVFLSDIPGDSVAMNKARQICAFARKSFSLEVQTSASVGIAVYPRDGEDFETLYQKADAALYHVKGMGKNAYAFYQDDMEDEHDRVLPEARDALANLKREKKRRMLIVDDNQLDHELLSAMFRDEYVIEKAKDGASALIRLRHYGAAISVVLLDLVMPGVDGFAVLGKMRESQELRSIPVVVVSVDAQSDTALRAIRAGASDYVTKPVDPALLRLRVSSAISKADNERLRAQNSFLELQSDEVKRYKTVLERSGVLVIGHDWVKGAFEYDPDMNKYVTGQYDRRGLWRILLSDMVTDVLTVKQMQELVHALAQDRTSAEARMTVRLKTPSKEVHEFEMKVYKRVDEYQLADKLILTLRDTQMK